MRSAGSGRAIITPVDPIRGTGIPRREREILALVEAGETSGEIARRLGLSPRSVDSVVHRARLRLGAATRLQAALLAADDRLAPSPSAMPGPARTAAPDHPVDAELRDLITALRHGATVTAAAHATGMSRRTASRRLAELRDRLGAGSTAQTVALACRFLDPADYRAAS